MPVKIDPSAYENLKARFAGVVARTQKKAASALLIEANLIMTNSKRRFVPVDLGTLRNSGMVAKPIIEGDTISIKLSYGGAAAPYAMAIHEHPSSISPPSWKGKTIHFRGGQSRGAKYLEYPLRMALAGMNGRLAERVKDGGEGDSGGTNKPTMEMPKWEPS